MEDTFTYRIDSQNNIIYVSENWCEFARDNNGADSCTSSQVLGKSLWDFISDIETRHIYELVIDQVRSSHEPAILPINCDSPDLKRFIEITIRSLPKDEIEFISKIIKTKKRNRLKILDTSVKRSRNLVRICSFCKKIATSTTVWEETGQAISKLKIFNEPPMPMLSHGVCPSCYEVAMDKIMDA